MNASFWRLNNAKIQRISQYFGKQISILLQINCIGRLTQAQYFRLTWSQRFIDPIELIDNGQQNNAKATDSEPLNLFEIFPIYRKVKLESSLFLLRKTKINSDISMAQFLYLYNFNQVIFYSNFVFVVSLDWMAFIELRIQIISMFAVFKLIFIENTIIECWDNTNVKF